MADETEADDGAIFDFWAFYERRRAQRRAVWNLERVGELEAAVEAFERERGQP